MEPVLPQWMDRQRAAKIAQLRALGYTQQEIADQLNISQQTVSRYQKGIHQAAESSDDMEQFLLGLFMLGLGLGAVAALARMFRE